LNRNYGLFCFIGSGGDGLRVSAWCNSDTMFSTVF
jgi:hypothetical protein